MCLGLCCSEWKSGICNHDIIYGTNVNKCFEINDIGSTQASMTINVDINVKSTFDINANNDHDNNVKICGAYMTQNIGMFSYLSLTPETRFVSGLSYEPNAMHGTTVKVCSDPSRFGSCILTPVPSNLRSGRRTAAMESRRSSRLCTCHVS